MRGSESDLDERGPAIGLVTVEECSRSASVPTTISVPGADDNDNDGADCATAETFLDL